MTSNASSENDSGLFRTRDKATNRFVDGRLAKGPSIPVAIIYQHFPFRCEIACRAQTRVEQKGIVFFHHFINVTALRLYSTKLFD